MLEFFKLGHYRVTLTPESTICMPAFNKGGILRGAFGTSLKRLVCSMDKRTGCGLCILKDKCAYTLIFNPTGINPAKRLQNVPRGYVLKPPLEREKEYTPDRPLSFEMILIGDRINYLPYVIVSLIELGKAGIGLNRGRFILGDIRVTSTYPPLEKSSDSIYDPVSNTVKNILNPITGSELLEYARKINRHKVTLQFLTPARIKFNPTAEKGKSNVVRVPEFHHIIRRLRDRINALSITYCGGPIDVDFKGIAERAAEVKTREANIRWIEIKRKSRTQPVQHDQSGFIGEITFEGDLEEFLPLIILGEYVHVGEDAVFGNGWYRIQYS
ncbi:MAG: CRISPR system precrRNA processing endoribonuclease RAMP protein Cas6 [Nitrospirae bacterium]|nr:CRISPR system precrRNA processing endoribonuclease RAMP protein Cas6 [Nitrospirota bacterium]